MTTDTSGWDAIVVGGGPAGSSVATYLAREKRRVLVLEREHFPREHIGESLLPGVLPYLDALGARQKVEAAGFERKEGQTFVWGRDRTPWEIDFRELDVHPYAYFVDRARFDDLLLRHAQSVGAEVRHGARVTNVVFDRGRATGVEYRTAEGTRRESARFIVDASGQSALVARGAGLRRHVAGLKNVAFWAYYEGALRLPGHKRAHILTTSIPEGWIWVIPLGDRTSVGIVTSRATRAEREGSVEAWFERAVAACEPAARLLAPARRVTPIRSAKDWSYRAARTSGPGIFLVGDSACFIDPILSTGVHLAMTSGYWAAACVHSALAAPNTEPLLRRFYEQQYLRTYRELLTQVRSFYRAEGRRDSIYWTSNRVLRMGDSVRSDLAFLFITAGLLRNAAFGAPEDVASQVREALGAPSVDEALASVWSEVRRGGHRRDVSPPMVWRAGGDQLVTLRAEGLRLSPVRYRPTGVHDRPRGTYFVLEVNDDNGWPAGLVVVEEAEASVTVRVVGYRGGGDLSAVRTHIQSLVAGERRASASLRRRVRDGCRALPGGLVLARSSALRTRGVTEPPLTVVCEHRDGGARAPRIYLVLEPRLPPDLVEVPILRTPRVDVWLRPSRTRDGRSLTELPEVTTVLDRVDEVLRKTTQGTVVRDLEAFEEAIRGRDLGEYRVLAIGRLGAPEAP